MRNVQSNDAIFKIRFLFAVTLLCILSFMPVYSASVQVFTYDEAMNEATISKPRIYVKNTGTTTLTDFDCYYYFTANGSEPILDNVNVTGAVVTIETLANGYRLKFSVTNANIAPGNVFPDLLGWGVELHMLNNPIWNKGDDFSNNLSSSFAENHNVLVTSGGVTIYGNDPQSIPELEFVNTVTNISMSLTHDGYLNTKLDIHEHSSNPPVTALIFEQNGNVKLNVSDNGVGVTDEVRSHTITPPLDGDMGIANQLRFGDIPAAGIGSDLHSGTDGDLMLAQKILGQHSISVYVDGGVFERGSNGSLQVAYANIGNEGREFYEDGLPTERRNFYIKDHLGSTRMVVSDATTIVEATSYQPYGTMVSLGVTKPEEPVKEKFTGKEFDSEGGENGAGGIGLFYFGERYYDAEIGRWTSTDEGEQFFDSYRYTTNPISFIDMVGLSDVYFLICYSGFTLDEQLAFTKELDVFENQFTSAGFTVKRFSDMANKASFEEAYSAPDSKLVYTIVHGATKKPQLILADHSIVDPKYINGSNPRAGKSLNTNIKRRDVDTRIYACNQNKSSWSKVFTHLLSVLGKGTGIKGKVMPGDVIKSLGTVVPKDIQKLQNAKK